MHLAISQHKSSIKVELWGGHFSPTRWRGGVTLLGSEPHVRGALIVTPYRLNFHDKKERLYIQTIDYMIVWCMYIPQYWTPLRSWCIQNISDWFFSNNCWTYVRETLYIFFWVWCTNDNYYFMDSHIWFFLFFLCGGGGGGYKTYFTEIKSYCEKPQGSPPPSSHRCSLINS